MTTKDPFVHFAVYRKIGEPPESKSVAAQAKAIELAVTKRNIGFLICPLGTRGDNVVTTLKSSNNEYWLKPNGLELLLLHTYVVSPNKFFTTVDDAFFMLRDHPQVSSAATSQSKFEDALLKAKDEGQQETL